MTTQVSESIANQALALNASGDLEGAYQILADAGDTYSGFGAQIVSGEANIWSNTVRSLWENIQPGSLDSWTDVATLHQRTYIETIINNNFNLPNTYQIESSYQNALNSYGFPDYMAIDILINTMPAEQVGPLLNLLNLTLGTGQPVDIGAEWYDILGIEGSRISLDQITTDELSPSADQYT
jgi:hypothetical protein